MATGKPKYAVTIETNSELLLAGIHGVIVELREGCTTEGNSAYQQWFSERMEPSDGPDEFKRRKSK